MNDSHGIPLADSTLTATSEVHLDPVQLHNRITFGMGHPTSPSVPLDVYHPDAAIHQGAVRPGLVVPGELLPSTQLPSLNLRARSQSHHGVQPTYRQQQLEFDPGLLNGLGHQIDPAEFGVPAHLRNRSRSLMNPLDVSLPVQPSGILPNPGQQPVDDSLRAVTNELSTTLRLTQQTEKKPLKGVLKVRKSTPEFEGHLSTTLPIPPVPHTQNVDATTASALSDLDYYGFSSTRASPPDPSLTLPDNLQAEYAQQLKLLQQEYAIKAAKAERTRQRSLERSRTPGSASRTAPMVEKSVSSASPKGVSFHDQVQVMEPVQQSRMQPGDVRASYHSWTDQWNPMPPMPAYARGEDESSSSLEVDSEAEIGSNVGDRGHDDHFKDLHEEYPPASPAQHEWSSPSNSSSAAPLPSPSGAISHGTESPATESIPTFDVLPSIQVEVIAPTPEVNPVELATVDEHVPRPLADGAHPDIQEVVASTPEEPVIAQQASPRTSAESSGSSDSNKTVLRIEPTLSEVAASTAQASVSNAHKVAASSVSRIQTPTSERAQASADDVSLAHNMPHSITPGVQRTEVRDTRQTRSAIPPISTNSPFARQSPQLQTSVFAPVSMLPDVASPTDSHSNSVQSFSDEPQRWDLEERTRLSSIPSVSSLSSGIMGHDRLMESPRVAAVGQGRLDSLRQRSMSALSPPSMSGGPASRSSHSSSHAHDDASLRYLRGRAGPRSVLSANELSSSASVESGSSHAASGASHLGRSYERSNAGSLLSHSSSGYGLQDSRGRAGSTASRRSNLSDAMPITAAPAGGGMPLATLDTQRPHQPLVPNMPSLDSISNTGGRASGNVGSGLPATRRGLGGDSIWTLGKEEEAKWSAPPSLGGQSTAPLVQQTYQYGPKSFVPEPPTSAMPRSRVDSQALGHEYGVPVEFPEIQHPYNPVDRLPARNAPIPSTMLSRHDPIGYKDYEPRSNLQIPYERHAQLEFPEMPAGYGPSLSSPAFTHYDEEPVSGQISVMLSPHELEQLRALRMAQVRAQAAPYAPPPSSSLHNQKRLPTQASTRSLPTMGSSVPPQYQVQPMPAFVPDVASGRPSSASRPSTALTGKSSHSGESGETIGGRRSVVTLPASGGVFPRYQEFTTPYPDASVRPGSSSGRFKSLFKSRDSRVFK